MTSVRFEPKMSEYYMGRNGSCVTKKGRESRIKREKRI